MLPVTISGTCNFNLTIAGPPPDSQAGVWITTTCNGVTTKGKAPMAYTLPDDHMVNVQISYVDSKGHPAQVDGAVNWTSSDTAIATVTNPDTADTTKAQIAPGANLGQAQITATADADLGAGVQNIITTFDVTVVAGMAVAGTIAPVGDPVPVAATSSKTRTVK